MTFSENAYLSWDAHFCCPERKSYVKDNARYAVDNFCTEHALPDPEKAEIPEEIIDDICDRYDIRFDWSGNIVSFRDILKAS